MKIQLDTLQKIVRIEESVNLGELINSLKKMLPNGLWKEFKLESQTIINWSNPIIVEPYKSYNPWPWYVSTNICEGFVGNMDTTMIENENSLNLGTFNILM